MKLHYLRAKTPAGVFWRPYHHLSRSDPRRRVLRTILYIHNKHNMRRGIWILLVKSVKFSRMIISNIDKSCYT